MRYEDLVLHPVTTTELLFDEWGIPSSDRTGFAHNRTRRGLDLRDTPPANLFADESVEDARTCGNNHAKCNACRTLRVCMEDDHCRRELSEGTFRRWMKLLGYAVPPEISDCPANGDPMFWLLNRATPAIVSWNYTNKQHHQVRAAAQK